MELDEVSPKVDGYGPTMTPETTVDLPGCRLIWKVPLKCLSQFPSAPSKPGPLTQQQLDWPAAPGCGPPQSHEEGIGERMLGWTALVATYLNRTPPHTTGGGFLDLLAGPSGS